MATRRYRKVRAILMGLFDAFKCKYHGCERIPKEERLWADPNQGVDVSVMLAEDKEDWAYLKRVCGVSDYEPICEIISKMAETLRRLRGEKQ